MLHLNILDENFNKIAIIDTFISLMWCKRYNEVGALDLEVEANTQNLRNLKVGRYISRDDDEAVYRIEALELNSKEDMNNTLVVGGVDLQAVLLQRISYSIKDYLNITAESYIRNLISDNFIDATDTDRNIQGFTLGEAKGFTDVIEAVQTTYDMNIGEEVQKLCKTYNYGYKVTKTLDKFVFDLYKGEEKNVHFSAEFDNLISTRYSVNAEAKKNAGIVGGEGEGTEQKIVKVGTASGLKRYEMYIDSDIQLHQESDWVLADYLNALTEQGKEELAQNQESVTFESEVSADVFEYKKDYNLGDIVIVKNDVAGAKCQIVEIIETWDDNGYTLEPIFEMKEELEKLDNLILTENKEPLQTEEEELLRLEQEEE